MPIAKIHLLTVATTRRAWLQILSVRISDRPLKLSKNKYPKYFLWYWDSYKPFYNIILKIASRCEKNLITLSILQNKSFKKYRQVFFHKYLKVLADRICKTFFSSLLQALGVFLRSTRDLVVWKWLHLWPCVARSLAIDDRNAADIEYIEDSRNLFGLAFLLACSPKIFWSWRLYYASWDLWNTVSIPRTRLKAFSLLGSDCSLHLFLVFLTFWGSYPFDLAHINHIISTSCSAHSLLLRT